MTAVATIHRRPRRIAADEAHAWARNLRLGNPYAKLVLSMLTLYVQGDGSCFVGIEALAEDTELSADTVRKRLAWLEDVGAIARFPQWVDASGRRNGEGKGKRTTDEIRLLLSADADSIERRALGENGESAEVEKPHGIPSSDELAPPPQQGQQSENKNVQPSVSPPVALCQPSDSGKGLTSEPEPEVRTPNPLSGGVRALEDDESFKRFIEAWHFPITDLPKAMQTWAALTDTEREDAITGAKGYRSYVEGERRAGRNRAIKDAHRWLRDKLWQGYLIAGKQFEAVAQRFDARENSAEWNAWTVFYRCCGGSGIPPFMITSRDGSRVANVDRQWPPVGAEYDLETAQWQQIEEGSGQFAAWRRRLHELPNVRIATRTVCKDGRYIQTLTVPSEWPPNKGGHDPPDAIE
jgi:hypothetical protein